MKALFAIYVALIVSASAALPEPDVVFYGRVVHRGGGEEYLMTSGTLAWQVDPLTPSQYTGFQVETELAPLNAGSMSYSIRIPNHLIVNDTVTGVLPGLPLANQEGVPFKNTSVTVNGLAVRLADPAAFQFGVSSEERGSFRRLDLIFEGSLPDSDGDGLPNWWETKYGTNDQLADASADLDGDGASNRDEYLAGTDPSQEDVTPQIAPEIFASVPIGGGLIPPLRGIDGDSASHDLVYIAENLPQEISIDILGRDQLWTLTFTQADVDAGRVIFRHDGSSTRKAHTINLTLQDEDPSHPKTTTKLRLSVGEEQALWDAWKLAADAPTPFPIVQDASQLPFGVTLRAPSSDSSDNEDEDEPRLYLGSPGADLLLGSAHDDIFVLGDGDTVQTGQGADRILFSQATGTVTVEDFSVDESDVLDFRNLLEPTSQTLLSAYIQRVGNDLRVDANGDGSGYTDLTVRFDSELALLDPAELWDLGLLEVGEITPETTLFLTTTGSAEEEDLKTATITLRRRGDAREALQVPLIWSGTATLGRDYASVPSTAVFAAGEKTVSFVIQPLADDERETDETVQVEIAASSVEWAIADGHRTASLRIADLPSRVWLDVVERVAYRAEDSPAQVLVRRRGPMNAPLTVPLSITGTAAANVDYRRLPASVTFSPAQDVIALDLTPMGSGNTNAAEEVLISIREDANYLFGETKEAQLIILDRPRTIAAWANAHALAEGQEEFLASDTDGDGLSGLLEFAFNGDPTANDKLVMEGIVNAEGCAGIAYQRWVGAPEIHYSISQSEDLIAWTNLQPSDYEETVGSLLPNGMERVEVFLKESLAGEALYLKIDVR